MKKTTNLQLNKPDYTDVADIKTINDNMDILDTEISKKANSTHSHTKSEITDFPTSLPANEGNADTVDGKHARELLDYNNMYNVPESLPANGGNADTVDGKHASDFMGSTSFHYNGNNGNNGNGNLNVNTFTTETHQFIFNYLGLPTTEENYGFLDVSYFNGDGFLPANNIIRQTFVAYKTGTTYTRTGFNGAWNNWERICDNSVYGFINGEHLPTSGCYGTSNNISQLTTGMNKFVINYYGSPLKGDRYYAHGFLDVSYFNGDDFENSTLGVIRQIFTDYDTGKTYVRIKKNGRPNDDTTHTWESWIQLTNETNANGADFAEYFEWVDGNPNDEDRTGLFVTLDGEKIKIANSNNKVIGIVSVNPTLAGDLQAEEWKNKYVTDAFGRKIYEDVEIPETVDDKGKIIPTHTERQPVINPSYNPTKGYISRQDRKEWVTVGLVGKLVCIDDGTCEINGYCKARDGGIATKSEEETNIRVMSRIDDSHIKVLIK